MNDDRFMFLLSVVGLVVVVWWLFFRKKAAVAQERERAPSLTELSVSAPKSSSNCCCKGA